MLMELFRDLKILENNLLEVKEKLLNIKDYWFNNKDLASDCLELESDIFKAGTSITNSIDYVLNNEAFNKLHPELAQDERVKRQIRSMLLKKYIGPNTIDFIR